MKSITCLLLISILIGCSIESKESNLKVDHVNIWVKKPKEAKEKLEQLGFTAIPDSLCKIHTGQGTTGKYFYFLNGYLELIYKYNSDEFDKNVEANQSLDFLERLNSPENGYLPFSIALKMENYDVSKIPFKTLEYYQEWMEGGNRIYVAENSKIKKEEPSIFVIYPKLEYDEFEHIDSLTKIPEAYSMWREFYKHKNGAKKITQIKIHSTNLDKNSETINTLNTIKKIELEEGDEHLMEIFFDNHIQGKTFDLRPDIPLKIYL